MRALGGQVADHSAVEVVEGNTRLAVSKAIEEASTVVAEAGATRIEEGVTELEAASARGIGMAEAPEAMAETLAKSEQ
jgi:hypothetical protein